MPERLKGEDCKSSGLRLRWFEPNPAHHFPSFSGYVAKLKNVPYVRSTSALIPSARSQFNSMTPSFNEALRYWLKLGFISFGGPAGQIAIMHQELVEKRRWISDAHFLHALDFCMLLPGPEAQQLTTYLAGACTARRAVSRRERCLCCRRCSSSSA